MGFCSAEQPESHKKNGEERMKALNQDKLAMECPKLGKSQTDVLLSQSTSYAAHAGYPIPWGTVAAHDPHNARRAIHYIRCRKAQGPLALIIHTEDTAAIQKQRGCRGDPLLPTHHTSILKLAKVMARAPNVMFI